MLNHPYNPMEKGEILICRKAKWNLQEIWPKLKKWG